MTIQQHDVPETTYSIIAGNSESMAVSAVSWAAIIAGATAAAALSMVLLVLGTALGLTAISPWSSQGIGLAAFGVGTLLWLAFMQLSASGVGGFITGRLRTRWPHTPASEVRFRDLAHGFLAWALASLLMATLLGSAAGALIGGGLSAGAAAADAAGVIAGEVAGSLSPAGTPSPADRLIAALFAADVAGPGAAEPVPADLIASMTAAIGSGSLAAEQRAAVIGLIASRRGIDRDSAEQRLIAVMAQLEATYADLDQAARSSADAARVRIAELALWLFASLLVGAGVASVAAVHGGRRRDC